VIRAGFIRHGLGEARHIAFAVIHPQTPRRLCRVQVVVRDNNIDQALKALKKKLQREGVFREMKLRRHYEKPSERRAREAAEAVRRARKVERKRLEREGF
jgi:small subunit ribosomal protein S21